MDALFGDYHPNPQITDQERGVIGESNGERYGDERNVGRENVIVGGKGVKSDRDSN